jgi:multiple sugar transport system permease protein
VETLSMFAFLENSNTRYGPAAAYSVLLFVYVVIVAFLFVKLLGADVIGDARAKTPSRAAKRRAAAKGATA